MAAQPSKNDPNDLVRRAEVESALRGHRTRAEAAKALGETTCALDHACKVYDLEPRKLLGRGEDSALAPLPPSGLTRDELISHLKKRYARLNAREQALKLHPWIVKTDKPIGLTIFGDLHIDDPGCDIAQAESDARVTRDTPGMYGVAIGDLTNNWIGKLQRIYGMQSVTKSEAWELVEWWFDEVRDWAWVILGNHDCWTGGTDSPLNWIAKGVGTVTKEFDARVAVTFSNGRSVRVHSRHDFPGRSIYNPAHGPLRAAIFGHRDHVKVAGHTHTSGYQIQPEPDDGIAMHLVRVDGYKRHDTHARDEGYIRQTLGPSAAIVIDPRLPDTHPDLIKVFHDITEGAEFLTWMRSRRRAA